MLEAVPNPGTSFPRLHTRQRIYREWVEAWIVHKAPERVGSIDWELWIKRNGAFSRSKCQLRLAVESRLRSWLLRECRVPLSTLTYDELRLIAEGKREEARHLHSHGRSLLMHRIEPQPIPHISAA
jgi:hypothetical protein